MHKSKLLTLLKSFSHLEIRKFHEYISSPYFNRNKTLIKFFNVLKKMYPEFSQEKISKDKIYNTLFPGKKFNEQVMKNLITDLNRHCRDFLEIELYGHDKFERKINLLKQLIDKKNDTAFLAELKILESDLSKQSELSEKNFYYMYLLEDLKISYHLIRNEQPLVFEKVLKSGEFLILFFHLHLSKTLYNLNVNRQSFNVSYKSNLPEMYFENTNYENIINYMKQKGIDFSELIELYYYRIICNTGLTNENIYYKYKELLLKNTGKLKQDEIYGLFIAAEAFCLNKINGGSFEFIRELFEVYNIEIKNGVYKFSQSSPVTFMKFRNTYLTALRLKKFEWTEEFIRKFKDDIIESDRDTVLKIALAQISFEKGNFEKVLDTLSGLKPELLYHKLDIRNLILMCHYENGYYDSVISLIDSFRHFLSGNASLSEAFRENNLRFINALNSFILMKEKNQKDRIEELKLSIMPYKHERRIEWLLEKINKFL